MKNPFKRIFNPDGKNMIPEDQNAIDFLLLNGGIEVAGIDSDTGQFLYVFTPKIKELMPALYNEHMNHVNGEIMRLWENGYVNIDFMEDNPIVTLTEKSYDPAEVAKLPKQDQWSLQEIKRLLKSKEL